MLAFSVTLTWLLLAHTCFAAPAGPAGPAYNGPAPLGPASPKAASPGPAYNVPASPRPASPGSASPGSASRMWENALCNTKHPDITPLDQPVLKYNKKANRRLQDYLTPVDNVFGAAAAKWQQQLFHPGTQTNPAVKVKPDIKPIRQGAPTIITFYYPHPNPRGYKSQDVYLQRILRLAKTKEQVIIYVAKSVSAVIKKMRSDVHWHVIDDYATIWEIPNNIRQQANFEGKQRKLFAKMSVTFTEQWSPPKVYDDGFYSAAYNAKAFIAFDAPLRNPFGSDKWIYMDAGLLLVAELPNSPQPPTQNGQPWDMLMGLDGFLDTKKLDRSISLTRNTGVVFPGYQTEGPGYAPIDINSKAFTDPLYQWQNKYFLGGLFVGNTLGMLNYAIRYMQTTDTLDANDRYIGREEFITPIVGAMYPNTVFYQPVQNLPTQLSDPKYGDLTVRNWKHMLLSYSTPYGANMLPEMRDPIAGLYCGKQTSYKPRGILAAGMASASQPK